MMLGPASEQRMGRVSKKPVRNLYLYLMRKARPGVIHDIANASSGSRRECQNHSRFAPCGSSRSAFSSHGPTLGGFPETGANSGGLKHQSAQCPSRHRAMNRGATPPNAARPQARKAAPLTCGVAQRRTGRSASRSARPSAACTSLRFIHSFAPHGRTLNRFQKMGGAEEKRLGFAPCAALTRQWARGNAGRVRPTAPPAGGAGGAARAG